ncbi:uncharacterized protein ASCRUDRAFT_6549 [Ascoidea rubescens DSM 1968]|uniref:Uncharacterized protein n=1 Tax=Ascoidea rubescens DSM 1968 TaxID=1344418 RepID=A0A1D2VMY3_9ASCO|nr:hypothetical protein ASCRUDRAFT_6549 [Ascoidea rubescens DSM 1968]ODV62927.1 hypothetical protein ASCRUDRAFT_6549 [Ascoidea rubescens DSM 1968]
MSAYFRNIFTFNPRSSTNPNGVEAAAPGYITDNGEAVFEHRVLSIVDAQQDSDTAQNSHNNSAHGDDNNVGALEEEISELETDPFVEINLNPLTYAQAASLKPGISVDPPQNSSILKPIKVYSPPIFPDDNIADNLNNRKILNQIIKQEIQIDHNNYKINQIQSIQDSIIKSALERNKYINYNSDLINDITYYDYNDITPFKKNKKNMKFDNNNTFITSKKLGNRISVHY